MLCIICVYMLTHPLATRITPAMVAHQQHKSRAEKTELKFLSCEGTFFVSFHFSRNVSYYGKHQRTRTGDLYSRQGKALRNMHHKDIQITENVRTIIQNLLNLVAMVAVLHSFCVWIFGSHVSMFILFCFAQICRDRSGNDEMHLFTHCRFLHSLSSIFYCAEEFNFMSHECDGCDVNDFAAILEKLKKMNRRDLKVEREIRFFAHQAIVNVMWKHRLNES